VGTRGTTYYPDGSDGAEGERQSHSGQRDMGGFTADYFNGWLQTYAQAENIPVVNLQYYLFNGCFGVVPPPPGTWPAPCDLLTPYDGAPGSVPVPNDTGYQFITQLAQTAIATYGLGTKSAYLRDIWTDNVITGAHVPGQ
jgi:hypothetical protein